MKHEKRIRSYIKNVTSILDSIHNTWNIFIYKSRTNAKNYFIHSRSLLLSIIPLTKALISKDAVYTSYSFISEIFMVVAGLIIILNTELIASIIPILIGIVMIINGVSKIQFSLVLKRENIKSFPVSLALAIVITCCGIIFITNPFKGAVAITKIIGMVIILYSILDMFDFLFIHKNVKNNQKETNEIKIIEEEK